MKVVCINDRWDPVEELKGTPSPAIGDNDEVIDITERYGETFYVLQRFGFGVAFLTSHFVELPDIPAEVIEEGIEEPETV